MGLHSRKEGSPAHGLSGPGEEDSSAEGWTVECTLPCSARSHADAVASAVATVIYGSFLGCRIVSGDTAPRSARDWATVASPLSSSRSQEELPRVIEIRMY